VHHVLWTICSFYRHGLLHMQIICLDVRLRLYAPDLRSRHYCVFNMPRCLDVCPIRATMDSSIEWAGRACQSNTHKLRWRHHMTVSGLQFSSFYFMFYIRYWRLSVGFNRRRQLVVVLSSTTTVARFASWLSVTQHRVGVMWPSTFLRVSRALTKCSVGDVVVPSAVLELTW